MPCSPRSSSHPLRVAVYLADQNPHRDRSQGISNMTLSLMHELHQRTDMRLIPVASRSSISYSSASLPSIRVPWRTDRALGRLACDAFHPWMLRQEADVWYYPKGYVSLLGKSTVPTVGTMHDAIIQHYATRYPHARSRRELNYWLHVTERSLRRLDVILTVSQHAKNQLLDFCRMRRIKEPNIEVTYESSDWECYTDRLFSKGDYVVHLTSTAPHKQTARLLELWESIQEQKHELPKLLLIGLLGPDAQATLDRLHGVTLLPSLDHDSLVDKVGSALALLFPSEIEGFGLPALEAYFVGTPVCYVSGTAVAEIVEMGGGGFGAFELSSPDSFYSALQNVLAMHAESVNAIRAKLHACFSRQVVCATIANHLYRAANR
jgi:glycosyltransferase involved in cell wall biosynthesis